MKIYLLDLTLMDLIQHIFDIISTEPGQQKLHKDGFWLGLLYCII